MSIKVNIPLFLQSVTGGVKVAEVSGNTVSECFKHLVKQFSLIEKELFDANGKIPDYYDIYVNGESAYPEELAKSVKDGDELHILVMIDGG